jgi:nanoRNase/pAp phosphatase (c-di-AMP/oligoRNAs hydrolase)
MTKSNLTIADELSRLGEIVAGRRHILIIVHTNPDPDAMASAAALKFLVEQQYGVQASIAYSGNIARAENKAMIKELGIYMKQINRITWHKYDGIALVDTQPGTGNNALPDDMKCHIVIDHHPLQHETKKADLSIVKPYLGVVATILIEWFREINMEIPADFATALAYAINSESQNLNRETNARDIQAYLYVYVMSNMRKLARIMVPQLPRNYFIMVAKTLNKAVTYRNLICVHLNEVPTAEIVSEMADFMVRHERISWSLCTGKYKDQLIISLRSRNSGAQAGKVAKELVSNPKTVGGHGMIAGGYINIGDKKNKEIRALENRLSDDFADHFGYHNAVWKPLIESSNR